MDKKRIDQLIPLAYDEIREENIEENGCVDKAFRGQIASFGAAVSTGSLLAAIAFFSQRGSAEVDRSKLMAAIWKMMVHQGVSSQAGNLFNHARDEIRKGKEREVKKYIVDCAVSLKLAMNLYTLIEDQGKGDRGERHEYKLPV